MITAVKYFIVFLLLLSVTACAEVNLDPLESLLAPPAETLAAKGGQFAGTQSAVLLQTAQSGIATQSDNLKETAKAQAATYAAALIDTAQANLVTQSANQATLAPTQVAGLKETAEAAVASQIADTLPLIQTQAALLLQGTPEFILGTALADSPPASDPLVAALQQTLQAAGLPATPVPSSNQGALSEPVQPTQQVPVVAQPGTPQIPQPIAGQAPAGGIIITFTIPDGLYISQAAHLLGISLERIIILNHARQKWPPPPGAVVVIKREPEELPVQSMQAPWSSTPGCNVSDVHWLDSPIACSPVKLDVVNSYTNSVECISPGNPFGRARRHTTYLGWYLNGAGGVVSYGWFIDRAKGAIVAGPALVYATAQSLECRPTD